MARCIHCLTACMSYAPKCGRPGSAAYLFGTSLECSALAGVVVAFVGKWVGMHIDDTFDELS